VTIQYINVAVGTALKNGDIPVSSKGRSTSQSSHVSIAYDDAVVLSQNPLLAALRQATLDVQSSSLPKG
jgi:hypothetical protein